MNNNIYYRHSTPIFLHVTTMMSNGEQCRRPHTDTTDKAALLHA
jgi:hypothetical protein